MIAEVSVTTNSKRFSVSVKDGRVRIALTSPPEKNRANIELIRELSRRSGRSVRILSGQTSKRKRLEIGMDEGEWLLFLSGLGERQ